MMPSLLHALTVLFLANGAAFETPVRAANSVARLVSDVEAAGKGSSFHLGFVVQPDPGWHVYWRNPGDSGAPMIFKWNSPRGVSFKDPVWPFPEKIRVGHLANYGYEHRVLLPIPIRLDEDAGASARFQLEAEWLVCKEECIPAFGSFELEIPVANQERENTRWTEAFRRARAKAPKEVELRALGADASGERLVLSGKTPRVPAGSPENLEFFPYDELVISNAADQETFFSESGFGLTLTRNESAPVWPSRIRGILVFGKSASYEIDVPVRISDVGAGLLVLLGFAFLGGLLLNLMPCVFPILSIKIFGLLELGKSQGKSGKLHGLSFAFGVLVCFWLLGGALLALRAGGAGIGWGFQLQSPWVVLALSIFFVVLGFNFLGWVEWGNALTRIGTQRNESLRGSFYSGALAAIVATPCTAPFMGAALGAAVLLPPLQGMAVFSALGLGMATPYWFLTSFPRFLGILPRPGAWMETLKQAFAFPMFFTASWLLWVLGLQAGWPHLGTLATILSTLGLCNWLLKSLPRSKSRGIVAVFPLLLLGGFLMAGKDSKSPWEPFDPVRLDALLADGRTVFVDFTAAWCVSCQVNKKTTLDTPEGLTAFKQAEVHLMRADWTRRDPVITQALEQLGRNGVPVYALYSKGDRNPRLLPSILSPGILKEALSSVK